MAFTIRPSGIPEEHPAVPPAEALVAVALAKARAVAAGLSDADPPVVLGADTEVVLDGRLLGKPADGADAARMLRALRGRTHEVITGVAVIVRATGSHVDPQGVSRRRAPAREETAAVVTRVTMRSYGDAEIAAYVATGEPLDKAGAYAVQGEGSRLVERVDGCFTNVVGLPVGTTRRLLERGGIAIAPGR